MTPGEWMVLKKRSVDKQGRIGKKTEEKISSETIGKKEGVNLVWNMQKSKKQNVCGKHPVRDFTWAH